MHSWTVFWYPWRTWDFTDLRMCFGTLPWWSFGLPSHSQMTCQYTLPGFCWIPSRKSSSRSQVAGKEVSSRWLISFLALLQISYGIRNCIAVERNSAFSKEAVIVTGVHVGGLKSYWVWIRSTIWSSLHMTARVHCIISSMQHGGGNWIDSMGSSSWVVSSLWWHRMLSLLTLLRTNISCQKATLKMIFLSQWLDMSFPCGKIFTDLNGILCNFTLTIRHHVNVTYVQCHFGKSWRLRSDQGDQSRNSIDKTLDWLGWWKTVCMWA